MESSITSNMAKRLWHIVRVVYYTLRKGISKCKLMLDLHLLLERGKLARKALGNLMTFHHHNHHSVTASAFSCLYFDPDYTSFYAPKEVEFSCSNTPFYAGYFHDKRKNRRHCRRIDHGSLDAAAIAKAFEMLNAEVSDIESVMSSAMPTPSPMWGLGRSPAVVRQLRVTDSPFPIKEEEEEMMDAGRIDKAADEFIMRFYEQLGRQQLSSAAATPDYTHCQARLLLVTGRA